VWREACPACHAGGDRRGDRQVQIASTPPSLCVTALPLSCPARFYALVALGHLLFRTASSFYSKFPIYPLTITVPALRYAKFPIDHCTPTILAAIYAIFPIYSLTVTAPSTHERHFSYISALSASRHFTLFQISHRSTHYYFACTPVCHISHIFAHCHRTKHS